jgi:hypothetical protein
MDLLPLPPIPRREIRCRNEECRRPLRDWESVRTGYGPECAEQFGLAPAGSVRAARQDGPDLLDQLNQGDNLTNDVEADPWRLAEWNNLPDECLIAACDSDDIDQRGPVWLRGGGMRKACVEHWGGIFRVLGEQDTWERTDGARSAAVAETYEHVG